MKTAQDYFERAGGEFLGGFNSRLFGTDYSDMVRGSWEGCSGWDEADKWINEGKIYYTHNFGCPCGDHSFKYGGFWVCNGCGRSGCDEPWWVVRVQKDGNAYITHGEDFANLQESDNYAFGDTREESLAAYKKLMTTPNPATEE